MPTLPRDRVGLVPTLLAVLALFAVVLASCGGGAPSKADEADVGQAAVKRLKLKVAAPAELCVGKSMVDDVGLDGARKVVAATGSTRISTAQSKAVVGAFDRCLPSSAFAAAFISEMPAGTSNAALEACLAHQFDGKVGTAFVALGDPNSDVATVKRFDACPTHDLAIQALKTGLINGRETPAVAECVAHQMSDLKLSDVLTQGKSLEPQIEAKTKACRASGTK
jgi:hypothetical protein